MICQAIRLVGSSEDRDAVPTVWIDRAADATLGVVIAAQTRTPRRAKPSGGAHSRGRGVFLSSSDFEALIGELESLRSASRVDRHTTVSGGAGPGSIVKVADRAGRISEYELILRPGADHRRVKVTLASPIGKALLGAREGDFVRVTLSNGRRRRFRVLDVTDASPLHPAFDGDSTA
jgi:hypothetical protein